MTTTEPVVEVVPEWTTGEKLRKIRRMAGLNQVDFAEVLGVNAGALSSWESGKSNPRNLVGLAETIRDLTGVPMWWFLGTEEPKKAEVKRPRLNLRSRPGESNPRPIHYKVMGCRNHGTVSPNPLAGQGI